MITKRSKGNCHIFIHKESAKFQLFILIENQGETIKSYYQKELTLKYVPKE